MRRGGAPVIFLAPVVDRQGSPAQIDSETAGITRGSHLRQRIEAIGPGY